MLVRLILGSILLLLDNGNGADNNICQNNKDYFDNIKENPNCWYDSDLNSSPEKIAENHGFLLERHSIKTKDGYILTAFRLKSSNGLHGKEVVFLQHGLGSEARCFMINGNKSMAFILSKQGFDVWLGNYRGNDFTSHEFLNKSDSAFWNFSFHEHALYDLPANFKYITGKTKRKIIYIGHSMGSTGMAIYASMRNKEASKYIKHAILISLSAYMRHTGGLTTSTMVKNVYNLLTLVPIVNLHYFMGKNSFERQVIKQNCFGSLQGLELCKEWVEHATGPSNVSYAKVLPFALKVFYNVCFKSTLHYAQLIKTGDFRMFDYGPTENKQRYNSITPPTYNLSEIIIPITLVYGETDYLASKEDVIYCYEKFRKENWDIYEIPHNHITFLFGDTIEKDFDPILLKAVNKYVP